MPRRRRLRRRGQPAGACALRPHLPPRRRSVRPPPMPAPAPARRQPAPRPSPPAAAQPPAPAPGPRRGTGPRRSVRPHAAPPAPAPAPRRRRRPGPFDTREPSAPAAGAGSAYVTAHLAALARADRSKIPPRWVRSPRAPRAIRVAWRERLPGADPAGDARARSRPPSSGRLRRRGRRASGAWWLRARTPAPARAWPEACSAAGSARSWPAS